MLLFSLAAIFPLHAQVHVHSGHTVFHDSARTFNRQDTLRGSVTPERAWWDLTYYHLRVKVDPGRRYISGTNLVQYTVIDQARTMQIDLQPPMKITAVRQDREPLQFTRDGNAWFIMLKATRQPGTVRSLEIDFEGTPRVAENAPWDGGFSWDTDDAGKPFAATSCQGLGASVWWPCKDHMYDEPDSMAISANVPGGLTAVANGQLTSTERLQDGTTTFHWKVSNPISNYVVNLNIADYAHFSEVYNGEDRPLQCDYYVLKANLDRAKEHFAQVPGMLEAFEHWFGPYPFYADGYKLVEVPYLGMEHQSSVTYGNHYQQGYMGRDLSGTGWGLKFDFIIIHESGHEWFANNITYRDIADMWIHESFTNYSEGLYVEYHFGKAAGDEYLRGIRRNILNDIPVIGIYDVNQEGSGDMYAKGASMLHTIRQIVGDDKKWRGLLRGLNEEFRNQTVTTRQIEDYMMEYTGLDLQPVFDQYLRTVSIPTLEYYFSGGRLHYRWINAVSGFNMPVKVRIDGEETWLEPRTTWNRMKVGNEDAATDAAPDDAPDAAPDDSHTLTIDPDFFVGSMNIMGRSMPAKP